MSKPLSVLLVEDSENDAELMLQELRRRGFTPVATRVDTGEGLQAALSGWTWDVIISDNRMPRFNGREALRMVRDMAPDAPFIVVSGTLGEEHAVEAMRAGADDFVIKTKLHRLAPVVERALREAARRMEQRRMAAALEESQRQLREAQKLEAIGRLAGGVAHDFNNLLGAIITYADLLLRALPADTEHWADVHEIKAAAQRAANLTRQLLEFSGRQPVGREDTFNLNEVIEGSLRLLRRVVGEDITLVVERDSSLWCLRGDPMRLEQILMNLAVNARDAMPGGGYLVIVTSNTPVPVANLSQMPPTPGNYVRLVVRDTGEGIPDDVLPKIFEPFFTTKESGKGTGLGLATVYGIVQQAGGSIFVETQRGRGTTFTIYLPADADGPAEVGGEPPAQGPF